MQIFAMSYVFDGHLARTSSFTYWYYLKTGMIVPLLTQFLVWFEKFEAIESK
jgi:hypothetical protein